MAPEQETDRTLTGEEREFLAGHTWAILATGRSDGSPQQSMIGYRLDEHDRLVISAKAHTAKWRNALRQPQVCVAVPDGRACLVVYGRAETIAEDPERAELTADVFAALSGAARPDPAAIVAMLDEQQRTVIRITPERVFLHA
ncbi:MAG: TIGR03618 family F420-dependent PPOX class oxidoreductase [Actinomycetota bacterium]